MIGIIDYNAGNISSVERALDALGAEYITTKQPVELNSCDRLIFPGVGDAAYAMKQLKTSGFDVFLKDHVAAGTPVLGICLGSQIIFDYSEEGDTVCLGLLPGQIRHFHSLQPEFPLKVPHMGWNDLDYIPPAVDGSGCTGNPDGVFSGCPLFKDIPEHTSFYFVHSYVIQPADTAVVVAVAEYGIPVPAAVQSGNVYAVQFHPEKSGIPGLRLLKNFSELVRKPEGGVLC